MIKDSGVSLAPLNGADGLSAVILVDEATLRGHEDDADQNSPPA